MTSYTYAFYAPMIFIGGQIFISNAAANTVLSNIEK